MLTVRIICVGKLKERFWKEACAEYTKRLQAYCKLECIEIPDASPSITGSEAQVLELEASHILKALPCSSHATALAIDGKHYSSEQFSRHLDQLALKGISDLSFIIGGSWGLDEDVYKHCQERLSFGKMTLPHNIARVVLLEQLYRAFKISRGEPYHK